MQCRRPAFDLRVRKIPRRRKWQPTPIFLPGKSRGQRSLEGYSSWGRMESDTTEKLCYNIMMLFKALASMAVDLQGGRKAGLSHEDSSLSTFPVLQ